MRKIIIPLLLIIILLSIGYFYFLDNENVVKKTLVKLNSIAKSDESESLTLCGWMPWWDMENAINDYEKHTKMFEYISPFIYLLNQDGDIENKTKTGDMENIKRLDAAIIPTIYNDFDPDRVSNILRSQGNRDKHINDIIAVVENNDWRGIELDYEYLKEEDRDLYSQFVSELAEKLHERDRLLVITLHAKTSDYGNWQSQRAQDWVDLSQNADYLRVMAYDYNHKDSASGPISPINWYKEVLTYAKSTIPKDKLIIGLGLYGYDWINNGSTTSISLFSIEELTSNLGIKTNYDENVKSPYIQYIENGVAHTIWFENTESVREKLYLAKNLHGVCVWKLGELPESIFQLFSEYFSRPENSTVE